MTNRQQARRICRYSSGLGITGGQGRYWAEWDHRIKTQPVGGNEWLTSCRGESGLGPPNDGLSDMGAAPPSWLSRHADWATANGRWRRGG
jgi:hypothetical protein